MQKLFDFRWLKKFFNPETFEFWIWNLKLWIPNNRKFTVMKAFVLFSVQTNRVCVQMPIVTIRNWTIGRIVQFVILASGHWTAVEIRWIVHIDPKTIERNLLVKFRVHHRPIFSRSRIAEIRPEGVPRPTGTFKSFTGVPIWNERKPFFTNPHKIGKKSLDLTHKLIDQFYFQLINHIFSTIDSISGCWVK